MGREECVCCNGFACFKLFLISELFLQLCNWSDSFWSAPRHNCGKHSKAAYRNWRKRDEWPDPSKSVWNKQGKWSFSSFVSQEALLFLLLTPDKDLFNPYDAVKWFSGRLCSAKLMVGLGLRASLQPVCMCKGHRLLSVHSYYVDLLYNKLNLFTTK